MDVVKVPVPEELVADVNALLVRLRFQGDIPQFDSAGVREHLLALSEDARTLLLEIAAGVLARHPRSEAELATQFGVTSRELFGIVSEINDITVRSFNSNFVYPMRVPNEQDPSTATRQLHMLHGYALMTISEARELGWKPSAAAPQERE